MDESRLKRAWSILLSSHPLVVVGIEESPSSSYLATETTEWWCSVLFLLLYILCAI
jgi:hypothetical protein